MTSSPNHRKREPTIPSLEPTSTPSPPTTLPLDGSIPKRISATTLLTFLRPGTESPPPVRPCDTPNGSDTTRHFTADRIYHLFGNRRFRNYQHFCLASKESKYINGGDPTPPLLGEFATIAQCPKGAPLAVPTAFLHKVHLDIVFGDGLGSLGFRYALLFVDRATRYNWVIGLHSLRMPSLQPSNNSSMKRGFWRLNSGQTAT